MDNSTVQAAPATAGSSWVRAGLLAMGVLLVANFTLVTGRHTGRWDSSDFFCPYFMLVADHARHGELLLWTPLAEGGCPAGFDPEIGAMSPLLVSMAAVLGPREGAFRVYWLSIWGLGGLGVLLLARRLRAPAWLGCVAAIAYMFSAVFTNQAEFTAYLVVMSALPWTLWRLDVALDRERLLPAAEAGAIWGLAALAGYPAHTIIGSCWLAAWVAARLCSPAGGALRKLAAVAVFGAVTLIVLSPAYLGFLHEMRGYSDRGGEIPRSRALRENALDPKALTTAASPYAAIAGAQGTKPLWTTNVAMSGIYLAPMLLVFGLAAPWLRPRDGLRWWLAAVALVCLAAALGDALPVRGWLYDLLPPMRYFRHAAIFRSFYIFTLLVLGLMAGRDLEGATADAVAGCWKRLALVAAVVAAGGLLALAVVCKATQPDARELPTAVLAGVHAAVVWLGTAAVVLLAWRSSRATGRFAVARPLLALAVLDAVLTIVLSKPAMYTKRSDVWPEVEAAHVGAVDLTGQGLARVRSWTVGREVDMNSCLVGKVPVSRCFNVLRNELYDASTDERVLGASAVGENRIWFTAQASLAPQNKATFQRLAARADALGRPCLVISDPPPGDCPNFRASENGTVPFTLAPACTIAPVQLRRYDGRHLDFDVTCAADGWLLVTDRWAPGWRAWVNQRPAKVWIGNLVYRAVPVEKGENQVRFLYCPFGYPWLLVGSWGTLALVSVGSLWAGMRRRTEQDKENG